MHQREDLHGVAAQGRIPQDFIAAEELWARLRQDAREGRALQASVLEVQLFVSTAMQVFSMHAVCRLACLGSLCRRQLDAATERHAVKLSSAFRSTFKGGFHQNSTPQSEQAKQSGEC